MRTLNVGFRTESFGPFSYLFERIAREKCDVDVNALDQEGFIDDLPGSR